MTEAYKKEVKARYKQEVKRFMAENGFKSNKSMIPHLGVTESMHYAYVRTDKYTAPTSYQFYLIAQTQANFSRQIKGYYSFNYFWVQYGQGDKSENQLLKDRIHHLEKQVARLQGIQEGRESMGQ